MAILTQFKSWQHCFQLFAGSGLVPQQLVLYYIDWYVRWTNEKGLDFEEVGVARQVIHKRHTATPIFLKKRKDCHLHDGRFVQGVRNLPNLRIGKMGINHDTNRKMGQVFKHMYQMLANSDVKKKLNLHKFYIFGLGIWN